MEITQLPLSAFPPQLSEIPQPPETLWCAGTLPPPESRILAVVGSRALSRYGKEACELLIGGLRGYPVSIVSGLALGADACAHRAALNAGLHTIAIPGSGLSPEALYPRAHVGLAKSILESGGALLSEHPPEYEAHKHDFPSRNRLMVGMAHAVLMVEAGDRSGTLITARLAGEYNRELLCIPHRITDRHAYGAQRFLRLGATLVAEPSHILEALRISPSVEGGASLVTHDLSSKEIALLELLETPCSRDDIMRASVFMPNETLSTLAALELKKLVTEVSGVWKRIDKS